MSNVQMHSLVEVHVDAEIEAVWRVVSDVTRTGEWSHECRSVEWVDGPAGPVVGARFRGRNRAGWARWTRTSELTVVDQPREIAWVTVPTRAFPESTEWRYLLRATDGGTLITQSFDVLRAPWLRRRLYAWLIPAHRDRDARLTDDLRRLGLAARRATAT